MIASQLALTWGCHNFLRRQGISNGGLGEGFGGLGEGMGRLGEGKGDGILGGGIGEFGVGDGMGDGMVVLVGVDGLA